MNLINPKQIETLNEQHPVYAKVAKYLNSETNNPDFAIGLLESLTEMVKKNRLENSIKLKENDHTDSNNNLNDLSDTIYGYAPSIYFTDLDSKYYVYEDDAEDLLNNLHKKFPSFACWIDKEYCQNLCKELECEMEEFDLLNGDIQGPLIILNEEPYILEKGLEAILKNWVEKNISLENREEALEFLLMDVESDMDNAPTFADATDSQVFAKAFINFKNELDNLRLEEREELNPCM